MCLFWLAGWGTVSEGSVQGVLLACCIASVFASGGSAGLLVSTEQIFLHGAGLRNPSEVGSQVGADASTFSYLGRERDRLQAG